MDATTVGILGAAAALAGVLLSTILQLLGSWMNHQWSDAEFHRQRRAAALDRRIDQSESFADLMTQVFYHAYDDILFYTRTDSKADALRRSEAFVASRDKADRSRYLFAPAIISLGDSELREAWNLMGDEIGNIVRLSAAVLQDKFARLSGRPKFDADKTASQLDELHHRYRDDCAAFLRRLDHLRASLR